MAIGLPGPNTLLIDSEQLESGDALDPDFREIAGPEIEQFKRELIERDTATRPPQTSSSDEDLLREVMNTVGKHGPPRRKHSLRRLRLHADRRMGRQHRHPHSRRARLRHPASVRAGGRPRPAPAVLRTERTRDCSNVEYADILGIPFDFTAKPVVAPPKRAKADVRVQAMKERAALEITFPARRRLPGRASRRADHRQVQQRLHVLS